MPRPPGDIVDINILTTYRDVNCETIVTVYIESLYKASKNLTISLLTFGLDDVVRGYFRPVAQRRWRHGRKARKGFWKKIKIPETGEIIAKWIPGQEAVASRYVDDGLKFLWHIDTTLQKWFNIVQIHELIDNFWMDLQSGIIKSPKTNCPDMPRMMQTGSAFQVTNVVWGTRGMNALVYGHNMGWTPFDANVEAGQFIAIFALKVNNNASFGIAAEFQARLAVQAAANGGFYYSSRSSISVGDTNEYIATAEFHGPGHVQWEIFKEGNQVHIQEMSINIFRIGEAIL